uniref:Chromosome 1 open reading frame 198 n=1 Tax=Iconisemion striatum TaxID=60296 RepID=A0A1A7Y4J4_9TELE
MAAATVAGLDPHRMEEKKFEYFSSINSMAKKIMQEREKIKADYGSSWETMTPQEQDNAIDNSMMDPHIRARYAMHKVDRDEVVCYPKLLIQTGQKIVHFGDEDITWQDEHSAPFSWETKSQLEFSLISGSTDQGMSASQTETKASKVPHSTQLGKTTPGTKVSVSEARRPEEESSFWKISAERSRLEGEKADFQSLTPSQIKSLEKGEKPLPSYLKQESSNEPETAESHPPAPVKSIKSRAPKPPAPQPPVSTTVSATPASISIAPTPVPPVNVSSTVAGWERSQSTLPSVSNTLDDVFSPSLMSKPSNQTTTVEKEKEGDGSPNLDVSPTFPQFNSNGSLLKTGFDFLDNW